MASLFTTEPWTGYLICKWLCSAIYHWSPFRKFHLSAHTDWYSYQSVLQSLRNLTNIQREESVDQGRVEEGGVFKWDEDMRWVTYFNSYGKLCICSSYKRYPGDIGLSQLQLHRLLSEYSRLVPRIFWWKWVEVLSGPAQPVLCCNISQSAVQSLLMRCQGALGRTYLTT